MAHGSMICPQCGKLIGVNEEKCPFCGAWRPGMYGMTPKLQKLFGRHLDVIGAITIACVVMYVASLLLEPSAIFRSHGIFSILSPGSRALYQLGMTSGAVWHEGWWWTLLTAQYLHGNLLHIFFNLWWVRYLGPEVEDAWGPARAFVVFNVAGVAGFAVSDIVSGAPTIGASGAIFGLLAALIVYYRRRGIGHVSARLWQLAIIVFAFGFFMSGVNVWAHGAGFAGGWVTATFMTPADERREGRGVQLFALLLIAATLLGVALSFTKVTSMMLIR